MSSLTNAASLYILYIIVCHDFAKTNKTRNILPPNSHQSSKLVKTHVSMMMMMMMMMMMIMMVIVMIKSCFQEIIDQRPTVKSYAWPESLSPIGSIANLPHTYTNAVVLFRKKERLFLFYLETLKSTSTKLKNIQCCKFAVLEMRNISEKCDVCTTQVRSETAQNLHRSSDPHG